MTAGSYIIRGGLFGRERLRLLARVMRPGTLALLARAGVRPGMCCLDIGCGGGDVTIELARLVGPRGQVTGLDFDRVKIDLAREEAAVAGLPNLTFAIADVTTALPDLPPPDLIYARFLLSHLTDPASLLARLVDRLHPGGLLVVEDIQISGHAAHPASWAVDAFVDLYRRSGQARGADPEIGIRLPGMLKAAGLLDIHAAMIQPMGLEGEVKRVAGLSMEAIADAVLAGGLADRPRIDAILNELDRLAADPDTLMTVARVMQCFGRKRDG